MKELPLPHTDTATPLTYSAPGGTAIAGLTDGQIVFVKTVHDANTIDVSATEGGSVINLTGTGNNLQIFIGETNTGITLTSDFGGSRKWCRRYCIKTTNRRTRWNY